MVGYLLANYKRFGNDALEVASDFSYEVGKLSGQSLSRRWASPEVTPSGSGCAERITRAEWA